MPNNFANLACTILVLLLLLLLCAPEAASLGSGARQVKDSFRLGASSGARM
jgi:hypothetical protein